MSADAPWFRFDAEEWLAGTRGLKPTECGILIHLLAMFHERGEPLEEDHDRLSRRCGATRATFKRSLEILIEEGKIERVDGCLWSTKIEKEIEYRAEKSANGKLAAEKRWGKTQQNQLRSNAGGMPYKRESREVEAEAEGDIPHGDIPRSSASIHSVEQTDPDALAGASGLDQKILVRGDTVRVGVFGPSIIEGFGMVGKERFLKTRQTNNPTLRYVPVSEDGRLLVNDTILQDDFEKRFAEKVEWVDPPACKIPHPNGRKTDAA